MMSLSPDRLIKSCGFSQPNSDVPPFIEREKEIGKGGCRRENIAGVLEPVSCPCPPHTVPNYNRQFLYCTVLICTRLSVSISFYSAVFLPGRRRFSQQQRSRSNSASLDLVSLPASAAAPRERKMYGLMQHNMPKIQTRGVGGSPPEILLLPTLSYLPPARATGNTRLLPSPPYNGFTPSHRSVPIGSTVTISSRLPSPPVILTFALLQFFSKQKNTVLRGFNLLDPGTTGGSQRERMEVTRAWY